MKKIILSVITLGAVAGVGLLNFTSFNNANNLQADKPFTFTNYTSSTGLASNDGTAVAFDDSTVAYASAGGLSIGTVGDDGYTFTNYNVTSNPNIGSNDGTGVAFDSNGDVGYVSNGGGLSIGTKSSGVYTFANYTSETNGITNNAGSGVAFDSDGDVAYCSSGGGLSVGIKSTDGYSFTNYSVALTTPEIVSDDGTGVAFDSNGNVGYVSLITGGLSIGARSGNTFDFNNYNASDDGIVSSRGQAVAFDGRGNVGYAASSGGGLSVGNDSTGDYAFTNYNTANGDLSNSSAQGVAFSSLGDVGYVSNGGGLSIGVQSGSIYRFTNYSLSQETPGITNDNGTDVAFSSGGIIGYTSNGGGLSIGVPSAPTISVNSENFAYAPRSNDDNLDISSLPVTFSYPLRQLTEGKYVGLIFSKSFDDNAEIFAVYITRNGTVPSGVSDTIPYDTYSFHSDDNDDYDFNVTNNDEGFEVGKDYELQTSVFDADNNEEPGTNTAVFTIPTINDLPQANFNVDDLNFVETGSDTNLYAINNFILNFSYPLNQLNEGEYIYVAVGKETQEFEPNLITLYLVASGSIVPDPETVGEVRIINFHDDNNTTYIFNGFTNSGQGFEGGSVYNLDVYVGSGNFPNERAIFGTTFETPSPNSEPDNPVNPGDSNNSKNSTQTGQIIGGVVGGIGGAAIISGTGLSSYLVFRRKRKSV